MFSRIQILFNTLFLNSRKHFFLFFWIQTFFFHLFCQDIHFSNYFAFPLSLSPSYAGMFEGDYRAGAGYRQQWRTVPVNYKTLSGWGDMKIQGPFRSEKKFLSCGIVFYNDKAGDLRYGFTQVQIPLSFHYAVDSSLHFSAGISAGITQTGFDPSKMTTDSQFDGYYFNAQLLPQENFVYTRYNTFQSSAGLGVMYIPDLKHKVHAHLAVHQPNNPLLSFQESFLNYVDPRFTIVAGYTYTPSNSRMNYQAEILIQQQGKYKEWIPRLMMQYFLQPLRNESFSAGISSRLRDAVMLHAGYTYRTWATGISYDFNLSDFRKATSSRGAWEIFLIKTFSSSYVPLIRKKPCPVFL